MKRVLIRNNNSDLPWLMPGRIQGSVPPSLDLDSLQFAKTEGEGLLQSIYHMNDVHVYLGRQRRLGFSIK